MDFDAQVAWPVYDWMGVAKAALEATSRYLARDLGPRGVRVNLVSAGPLGTIAARGIPGFAQLADAYGGDDGWVYEAVAERADRPGWTAKVSVAQDAAFHRYARGATDYAP